MDVSQIGRAETQYRSNVLWNRAVRQNPLYPFQHGGTKGINKFVIPALP